LTTEVTVVADWRFTVYQVEDESQVGVEITVFTEDDTAQHIKFLSKGDLAVALLAAYDSLGLVCPLVPDNDVARLAGSYLYQDHPTSEYE
jgi:hypothetical protein